MNKNLDAEISAVDVVAKEEIASLVWRSADFKQFHEVKELSVHVAAHCNTTINIPYTPTSTYTIYQTS